MIFPYFFFIWASSSAIRFWLCRKGIKEDFKKIIASKSTEIKKFNDERMKKYQK